ncbi:hypothetical protein WR25_15591 [Diploscapter pachys]|uniref:Uncharacterized protein n=1 Tax=Diploscapter pachys TaxID=2018661 RepID=A0A2A2K8K2_9BILA|nr:hypothetical protein WR25_15591 [Diploscapter pachys]
MPHRAIARRLDIGDREGIVGGLQLLQADDVGLLFDREAGAAAATRRRIGVIDAERRTAQRFDVIDLTAAHEVQADTVDDQADAIRLRDRVVPLGRVGESELVLEPRTAAAIDRQAQDGRLVLLARNRRDARGGSGGEGDVGLGHAAEIGAAGEWGNRLAPRPCAIIRVRDDIMDGRLVGDC